MKRIFVAIMIAVLQLAGCGSSTNAPMPGAAVTAPIADKPDVIVTVDGAHHTCVAALYTEAQGSTIACSEIIPFIRDELRVPSGSIYDIHATPATDNAEVRQVRSSLTDAGYRFIGGHP
jgi:hypothetical protein